MDRNITPEMLQRYAQGRCTPEEIRMVEQWLEQETDPFEERSNPLVAADENLRDELWKAVRPFKLWHNNRFLWKVAASVLLVSAFIAIGYTNLPTTPKVAHVPQQTITAPKGQTKLVRFPDRSVVLLQGGATIRFPENFSTESRSVTLVQGKALFDITHDPVHPFIVNSGATKVEVLGTRFVVNNQPKSVQVTLARGKVRFLTEKTSQLMKPGQQLDYDKNTAAIEQLASVDTSYATAWTRQSLWFNKTPLTEVLTEISNVYGIRYKTGSKVDSSRLLNGRFDEMPLPEVLVLLENSTGYRFRLKNGVVLVE